MAKRLVGSKGRQNNQKGSDAFYGFITNTTDNAFSLNNRYQYTSFSKEHAKTMKKIWGATISVGFNMLDAIKDGKDLRKAKKNFDQALRGKYFSKVEQYGAGAQRRFYEDRYGPIKSKAGKITGLYVWVLDFTRFKRAEQEINHYSSLLSSSLESVEHGILVVDTNERVVFKNNKFLDLWKIPQELSNQKSDWRMLDYALTQIADREKFIQRVHELYQNPTEESRDLIELIDGRVLARYTRPHFLKKKIVGRVWSFQDITAQELAEREIRHLASFPLHSPVIILEINKEGALNYGNPAFYEAVRRLGLTDHQAFLPEEVMTRPPQNQHWKSAAELVVKGRTFSLKIFYLPEKELTRIYAFDLTERLEAEKQKSDLELTYKTLFESATDSIMLMDAEEDIGKILSANPVSAAMYSYTLDEFLKLRIQDLDVIEPGVHISFEERQALIQKNNRQTFEVLHRKKDGTLFPLEAVASVFELSGKRVQMAMLRDITQRKKAEEEIKLQYRFIESLAAASPDVVYVYDLEQEKYVYGNERMAEAYGHPLPQILEGGHTLMIPSMHPEDAAKIPMWKDQVRLARDGEVIESRFRLKTSVGGWRTFQSREAVFVRNQNGSVKQIIGSSIDITIQVQAEEALRESEQRFRVLHEASFGGIAIHDMGVIVECNTGLSQLTGYTYQELIGINGLNLIHPDDRPIVMDKIKTQDEHPYDVRGLHKDGHLYALEIKGKPVPYQGKMMRVTEFRDITERIKTAESIKEQNTRLQAIAENLRFKNQQLDEFTQIVSHNLRAPAGNIVSLSDFLAAEQKPDEREKILSLLKHSGSSILTTLTELNEVLKIKQTKNIEKQNLLFDDVYQRVCQMLNAQISAMRATMQADFAQAPIILYPHIYLESILLNLISNALKYSDPMRPLHINCRTYVIDNRICLDVADSGLGINLERYGHQIFKMRKTFHHHPESRGIGLFMVKNQIEAMGGKITVESREGQGSVFRVVF